MSVDRKKKRKRPCLFSAKRSETERRPRRRRPWKEMEKKKKEKKAASKKKANVWTPTWTWKAAKAKVDRRRIRLFFFCFFFVVVVFFFELAFQTQRQPEINQWKPEKLPRLQRLTFWWSLRKTIQKTASFSFHLWTFYYCDESNLKDDSWAQLERFLLKVAIRLGRHGDEIIPVIIPSSWSREELFILRIFFATTVIVLGNDVENVTVQRHWPVTVRFSFRGEPVCQKKKQQDVCCMQYSFQFIGTRLER